MRRVLALAALAASAVAAQPPSAERRAATEADYKATLARLGIASLRPGADGYNRAAANAVNYDEAKAGLTSPLPPLLTVAKPTARWWWTVRRPQLVRMIEDEMVGRVPATAPTIVWRLDSTAHALKDGIPVLARHYRGGAAGTKLAIDLWLTVPEGAPGPVAVILELGFPEGFRFPGFPPQPAPADPWTAQILRRGWGYAILDPRTVQPDDGAGLADGVIGAAAGGKPRGPHEWGALRAWAWGAGRALDLLARDPRIDRSRVAVEGLSRYGKAALVTMAFEPGFSMGFIGSSGAGGAKLLRRDFGERIGNLAASGEYHWFAPAFLLHAGPRTVDDLPFDAHSLIALAAPRPLFFGAGRFDADGWVDPRGSFEAARAATPAWRLLGAPGLVGEAYPAINEGRTEGRIAFRQQDGGHSNARNWPAFLAFAARQWRLSAAASPRR
ncbi:MAG TPA: hypothetical protein VGC56_00385 [Allosphingosinicella sp.]